MTDNHEITIKGWVDILIKAGVKISVVNALAIRLREILTKVEPGSHMPDEVFAVFEEALARPLTNQEKLDIRDGFDSNWRRALNIFDQMHD